jgi:cell shape-determining protein MreC
LQDQQNFSLAFEDFQTNHQLDGFRMLMVDFPDSVWASRAETIILYSQELNQRKAQNQKLRESERQQILEIEQLKIMNQQLSEKIEQFKSLLIQSEQHPQ